MGIKGGKLQYLSDKLEMYNTNTLTIDEYKLVEFKRQIYIRVVSTLRNSTLYPSKYGRLSPFFTSGLFLVIAKKSQPV